MQEYKLVVRGLVNGATKLTPDGNVDYQNFSEFLSLLDEKYLSQGYKINSVQNVRTVLATETSPLIYEFAYHLVKDYEVEEPKAKK
jgi:hypothetical protein